MSKRVRICEKTGPKLGLTRRVGYEGAGGWHTPDRLSVARGRRRGRAVRWRRRVLVHPAARETNCSREIDRFSELV